MELAEKLKYHRKQQGLSQENVANILNLSRQAISRWENGHTIPDIDNLILLSNLYKITTDELLKESNQLQQLIQEDIEKTPEIAEEDVMLKNEALGTSQVIGLLFLLLAIVSIAIFPLGFLLAPFVAWKNNRMNAFHKLIYIVCIFSIFLNFHTAYAHLTAVFNWGVVSVEQIE